MEKYIEDILYFDETKEEVHYIEDIDAASDFELKHTPNIEVINDSECKRIKVTIGLKGISHPQTEEHLIEWFRVEDAIETVLYETFDANETPEAEFNVYGESGEISVLAFCNLHGVWKAIL